MSSHLKVELQKLKRGFDGGYGFDLTRFCAGCWNRLGRILRRGLCCDSCGKRVCKSCRHFLDEKNWICVLCYKKKFSREAWWHDEANVQRFKGSQGRSGTYLLRLTDWSSHGVLDALRAKDTLGRRIHSFSEESFFATQLGGPITPRNLKSKSWALVHPGPTPEQHFNPQLTSQLGWNWNQKWRLKEKNDGDPKEQRTLQYTSTTLKSKRREIRELSRMSQKHELSHEVRKSSRRRRNPSKTRQSSNLPDESDPKTTENPNDSNRTRIRIPVDYDNFLAEVSRNDLHARMSVRGSRVYGRKKKSRPYFEGHAFEASAVLPTDLMKCRSLSLPTELHHSEHHQDDDFWNAGFVQSRVRRLEEDLASSKWHENYINYDFEVQSLCSLEPGRILPDSEGYRIAYLSSVGTSLESSLDYIEDSIFGTGTLDFRLDKQLMEGCPEGMGTLDVRLRKKEIIEDREEDDWDMSLSSLEENGVSSSEDDEFEFIRINETGANIQTHQCDNSNEFFNETKGNLVDNNHDTKTVNGSCSGRTYNESVDNMDRKMEGGVFEPVQVYEISGSCEAQISRWDCLENNESTNEIKNNALKGTEKAKNNDNYDTGLLGNSEIKAKDDIDCPDCKNETPKDVLESQQYRVNKSESNFIISNSRNGKVDCIDQNNVPKTESNFMQKTISTGISETQHYSNSSVKNDFNLPSIKCSKEKLLMKHKFIENSPFLSKKKTWHHKTDSMSIEPFDKVKELFNYEPLSTPFAEIFAINCNPPQVPLTSSFIGENQQESRDTENYCTKQNLINEVIYSGIYSEEKENVNPYTISFNYFSSNDNSLEKILNETNFWRNDSLKINFNRGYEKLEKELSTYNTDDLFIFLGKKYCEISVNRKYMISHILEMNKIDIFRTLTNETAYLPLVGYSLKYCTNDCLGADYNFNFKTFFPKYRPFYAFDTKSFLPISKSKIKQNKTALHYIDNINTPQIRYTNKCKTVQESIYSQKNVSEYINGNSSNYPNRIPNSNVLIPIEKLPFYEENYFNTYTDKPTNVPLKYYNFHQRDRCIVPVLHLFAKENELFIKEMDSNLHALMKHQLPLVKPHLRNRNYMIRSDLCHSETELANRVTSETSESRFANSRRRPTSRTGSATCVEYHSPSNQSESTRECSEARLFSGSVVTVPAVVRVAKRESSCSWAVRPTAPDGANREATDHNNQNSCCAAGKRFCDGGSLILDYSANDRISNFPQDYNDSDNFGYSKLTVATNYNNTCCFRTELRPDMATCNSELPRSLGKHVRAQGKNISKLMRLFDSGDRSECVSPKTSDCRTKNGVAQQSQCVMDNNQLPNDTSTHGISIQKSTCVETREINTSVDYFSVSEVIKNVSNIDKNPENSTSDIPYCRKVPNGGLWENVNIGNGGLWNTSENDNNNQTLESNNGSKLSVSSTSDLHNLIAVSKAELSKMKEPSHSDKSNLENYFTSFENSKYSEKSSAQNGTTEFLNESFHSTYDCDINEMSFEDEEAMLSDTSSDEDLRSHPAMTNTNYLPAYALHTIIEESCEESERDSRTTTPTNDANTSKLERYFSWDIINDAEVHMRKKSDDQSTIYSDSLSESSGSVVADDVKEIDPTHLASSRLEKYFTSGLVDDQNYFYPEDAEFLDDAPVSDFEEDSIHQKISRSALLSSLETMPTENNAYGDCTNLSDIKESESIEKSETVDLINSESLSCERADNCDTTDSIPQSDHHQSLTNCVENTDCSKEVVTVLQNNMDCTIVNDSVQISSSSVSHESENIINHPIHTVEIDISENVNNEAALDKAEDKTIESCTPKPVVNKDQLAVDIQAIIKKLLSYFTSETNNESYKDNIETDYISAWQLLETEIERLLQSISPNGLENNSCSNSMIDSNNSDYGSDTIESLDCMTDDDDNIDGKSRVNAKCPLVDILSSSYKIQTEPDLSSFNISDETLNIWKRLILSLQRDNSLLSENKVCDPTAEARLYIRDQIVTLMHTVTVNDSLPETIKPIDIFQSESKEVPHSLVEESGYPEEINEAFNVSLGNSDILMRNDESDEVVKISKSGLSSDNTDDILPSDISVLMQNDSIFSDSAKVCASAFDIDSRKITCHSNISEDNSSNLSNLLILEQDKNKPNPKPPNRHVLSREVPNKDSELKFSVVDIELGEDNTTSNHPSILPELPANEDTLAEIDASESSLPEKTEIFSVPFPFGLNEEESQASTSTPHKSSRDTGYYSFKSSDDSLLNTSSPAEFVDVPNFKSLKRTVKKFPLASSTLSKSSGNILQSFSAADAKFSTLQLKPKKAKSVLGSSGSSQRFSSLFSPSAVLKRFTGSSKSNETPNAESSIPPKYLKKYARSVSVDNESLFGAVSMPVLSTPKPGDSYSALGLYSENDRDSSLTLDDEAEAKRYFSGSQSVLSLGAHSASMTSVYSAAACHYGYVTVSGDVLFGLNYNQKSQMMEVFVKQCRNLAATDARHNKSNPYVKVYLLPDKTRSGKRKTKTKKNTVNPVFNELLRFPVLKNEMESRTLWLSVWNSDLFGRNDFLGEISLPLGYRLLDSPTLRWYPLQERVESLTSPLHYRGELFLALKYVPRDLSLEPRFRPGPVISLRGALHVLVKEARNITPNRSSGTLDAFCKSYLLPDKSKCTKQKTPVVRRSGHPKWYCTLIYEDLSPDELRERSLQLTLWDHDKLANNRFMGGIRLNIGSGLYHGLSVDWMDARRDESSLWQSMLDSPNMWVDGCLPLRPTMQFHNS